MNIHLHLPENTTPDSLRALLEVFRESGLSGGSAPAPVPSARIGPMETLWREANPDRKRGFRTVPGESREATAARLLGGGREEGESEEINPVPLYAGNGGEVSLDATDFLSGLDDDE